MLNIIKKYVPYIFAGLVLAVLLNWFNGSFSTFKIKLAEDTKSITTQSLKLSFSDAVKRASPSVVSLYSSTLTSQENSSETQVNNLFKMDKVSPKISTEAGSGVIVGESGYIITNHHVVQGADEIVVTLSNGKTYPAIMVGSDPETDLSILKIAAKNLIPIVFGQSKTIQVGDIALAIGNPFGQGQSVSMGIISATGKDRIGINTYENFIQTDAAINPGNSGGALINQEGKMIGVNSAIFSRSGGSQGIGFAIPVSTVKNVLLQIVDKGYVTRGWLGIEGRDLTALGREQFHLDGIGVYITGVYVDGPAHKAGLKAGDILLMVNGFAIADIHAILKATEKFVPGSMAEIQVQRDGKFFTTKLKVQQRPLS